MFIESRGRYALSLRPIEQVLRGSDTSARRNLGEPRLAKLFSENVEQLTILAAA